MPTDGQACPSSLCATQTAASCAVFWWWMCSGKEKRTTTRSNLPPNSSPYIRSRVSASQGGIPESSTLEGEEVLEQVHCRSSITTARNLELTEVCCDRLTLNQNSVRMSLLSSSIIKCRASETQLLAQSSLLSVIQPDIDFLLSEMLPPRKSVDWSDGVPAVSAASIQHQRGSLSHLMEHLHRFWPTWSVLHSVPVSSLLHTSKRFNIGDTNIEEVIVGPWSACQLL